MSMPWRVCFRFLLLTLLAMLGGLAMAAGSLQADEPPPSAEPSFTNQVRIGIANHYQLGYWVPLEVELQGGTTRVAGTLSVLATDGDRYPTRTEAPRRIELPPGETVPVRLSVRLGRWEPGVTLRFDYQPLGDDQVPGGQLTKTIDSSSLDPALPQPLLPSEPLVVVVGPSLDLKAIASGQDWEAGREPVLVEPAELAALPDRPEQYQSVETLVLNAGADASWIDELSDGQRTAIVQWVRQGGQVLISVGPSAPAALAESSFLSELIPGKFSRLYELTNSRSLESFAAASHPLFQSNDDFLTVAALENLRGTVLADYQTLPLVVQTTHGFGQVMVATIDLGNPILADWRDRKAFFNRLLRWQPADAADAQPASQRYMQNQINDLTSDLLVSLDRFPKVPLVPFSLVAGLIVGYLLIVGPLDYFLVKYGLRRMEFTWFTFPLLVVLASGGAYYLGTTWKSDEQLVRQVEVVDVDVATGGVRGTAWMNLYSPQTERYDLTAEVAGLSAEQTSATDVHLTWLGVPEKAALRGMNAPGMLLNVGGEPYATAADSAQLQGVPLQVTSTKAFTAEWTRTGAELITCEVETVPGRHQPKLKSVKLTNQLPFELQDCWLLAGNNAYPVGVIPPGEPVELGLDSPNRQDLKSRLRLPDGAAGSSGEAAPAYEPGNAPLPMQLRMMMFYRLAAGRGFTGLEHDFQRHLDLSGHIESERVILLARAPQPALTLQHQGESLAPAEGEHVTYYRFVLPTD